MRAEAEPARGAADRRVYFRVRTHLRFGLRLVSASEREEIERAILERERFDEGRIDAGLVEWLRRVEEKLDLLLDHAGLAPPGFLPRQEGELELSGGGALLPSTLAPLPAGAVVMLELELPLHPPHQVRCLATVLRLENEVRGRSRIAVELSCIREEDRDAIVRHTLAVQRRELALRARMGEAEA